MPKEAVIRDGGRQYKVCEGATLEVDYRDAEPGAAIEFTDVLLVRSEGATALVGSPLVHGAKVVGKVVGEIKGPKLVVASFRRRKNSRRRVGHRQKFTRVYVERIES